MAVFGWERLASTCPGGLHKRRGQGDQRSVTHSSAGSGDQQIAANVSIHDRIADKYDRHHTEIFNAPEQARLADALAGAIAAIRSADGPVRALDMGCGSGNLTKHLLALGCHVTASDVSAGFLRLVNDRFAGQHVTTARLNGVDLSEWPDDSFDLVATYSVLHHIPDYLAAVGEMGRVCRPGGVVYIDHEHAPDYWTAGPVHHDFRKQALRPDLSKWLRPINYYGKIRRLFDPKFANEGDIHVWPDDHIEWDRIIATLGSSFEPVLDNSFLLYDGRYRPEIYAKYSDSLVDMRVMAFRKR